MNPDNFYENFKAACRAKQTTPTTILKKIGRSTSLTGSWQQGVSPSLQVLSEICEALNISLDELCYGREYFESLFPKRQYLSQEDQEWLAIIHGIPEDRRRMCRDFLYTHMMIKEKTETA